MKITKKIESYEPKEYGSYEFKIEQTFTIFAKHYIVKRRTHFLSCKDCGFTRLGPICTSLLCGKNSRRDGESVIFKQI